MWTGSPAASATVRSWVGTGFKVFSPVLVVLNTDKFTTSTCVASVSDSYVSCSYSRSSGVRASSVRVLSLTLLRQVRQVSKPSSFSLVTGFTKGPFLILWSRTSSGSASRSSSRASVIESCQGRCSYR